MNRPMNETFRMLSPGVMAALVLAGCQKSGPSATSTGVTPGWENICATRAEFPLTAPIWRADFAAPGNVSWEMREGAEGRVELTADGLRVVKTNSRGYIIITAKAFPVKKGQGVRFSAETTVASSDVNYSSGALRYYGRKEKRGMCSPAERQIFWSGGTQAMRALVCTAPGMRDRKYAQCFAEDDVLTPVILVGGAPSDSTWSNWLAEDLRKADDRWGEFVSSLAMPDYSDDRMDEAAFDAKLAEDFNHVAAVKRIDGVSRLTLDGEIVAPAVFKARHMLTKIETDAYESFAGQSLNGSSVKIMVKHTSLREHCQPDGSKLDVKTMAYEIKNAMRLAPDACFVVAIGMQSTQDFVQKYHPEEAWLNEKGEPVIGLGGSCLVGYLNSTKEQFARHGAQWPSPSSRVWRDWVNDGIRAFVAELKRQGLSKRVVGIHIYGFHDGQFSVPFIDQSKHAKAEYAKMIAEPGCLSTNYAFCCKQMAFRAQEEFVRTFKKALGKPSIGVMWCESPLQGARNASIDITSFVNSDAMDVVVCQPDYRERRPGFRTGAELPMDSLHLHGKMFWNELDFRTYAPVRTGNNAPSLKSLGASDDFPMWQTVYRKAVGELNASRMGYWFYDMSGGWYATPSLAADIRRQTREEAILSQMKPSAWQPDVAVVIDELQILQEGNDPLGHITSADNYIYAASSRLFGSSGVPHQRFLADDVLKNPALLDGKKMVVLAFFREIDARRRELLVRLAKQGTTLVYLSETGIRGGADVTRFTPIFTTDKTHSHEIVPEPGVSVNVMSLGDVYAFRDVGSHLFTRQHCTVKEDPGVKVLARYASDGQPAIAERRDGNCRRVYIAEPGGLTPQLMNLLARESGAYVPVAESGLQVDMNGDFISVHAQRAGRYAFMLPFACTVVNLKTLERVPVSDRLLPLTLTAGETVRFWIGSAKDATIWEKHRDELNRLADFPAEVVADVYSAARQKWAAKVTLTVEVTRKDGAQLRLPLYGSLPQQVPGTRDISMHDGGTVYARVFFDQPSVVPGKPTSYDGIFMKHDEFLLGRMNDGVYFNMFVDGKWRAAADRPKVPSGRWVDIAVVVSKGEKAYVLRYYVDGEEVKVGSCPFGAQIAPDERALVYAGTCWGDQWRLGGKIKRLHFFERQLSPAEIKELSKQ